MQVSCQVKLYMKYNVQDFMRPMKVMSELFSKHAKTIAKEELVRPFNNWKKENQQRWWHDRCFKKEREEFQRNVRDPWGIAEALK